MKAPVAPKKSWESGDSGKIDFGAPGDLLNFFSSVISRIFEMSRASEIVFSGVSGSQKKFIGFPMQKTARNRNPPLFALFWVELCGRVGQKPRKRPKNRTSGLPKPTFPACPDHIDGFIGFGTKFCAKREKLGYAHGCWSRLEPNLRKNPVFP